MPEPWEKAFAPTTALERGTAMPLISATMRLVFTSSRVRMPVSRPEKKSGREWTAMTTSSSAVFPARSPMPLIVPSTCRAPARMAARELATAIPMSSWQWTEMTARSTLGTLDFK